MQKKYHNLTFNNNIGVLEGNISITCCFVRNIVSDQCGSFIKIKKSKSNFELKETIFDNCSTSAAKGGCFSLYVDNSQISSCQFRNCHSNFYYHIGDITSTALSCLTYSLIYGSPLKTNKGGVSISLLYGNPLIDSTNYSQNHVKEFSASLDFGPSKGFSSSAKFINILNCTSTDYIIWIFQTGKKSKKIHIKNLCVFKCSTDDSLILSSGGPFIEIFERCTFQNNKYARTLNILGPTTSVSVRMIDCIINNITVKDEAYVMN